MIAKVETLEKIAREVLGDAELARSMVEEVLIAVRRVSRGIPRDGRDVMKLRTLVGQLYRADQERARGGGWQADGEPSGTMVALQALDFDTRVAYALSAQYRIKSVAEVMDISEGEASAQIERARDFVRANTATAGGPE